MFEFFFHCVKWGESGWHFVTFVFNAHMDELSSTMNNAKAGCMINGCLVSRLMYADDLV